LMAEINAMRREDAPAPLRWRKIYGQPQIQAQTQGG
jgi:hypothetical protein